MRHQEGGAGAGASADGRGYPPGSRPSRLSDASKQLSILLQEVDLDDEPALAEALAEAVRAVGRANDVVHGEFERNRAEEGERSSRDRRERSDRGDRPTSRERDHREGRTIESGRIAFVPEAGAK